MRADFHHLAELKGKHVNLVIGLTGAGKSTVVNSILNGKDALGLDEDDEFVAKEPIIYNGFEMFKIGA